MSLQSTREDEGEVVNIEPEEVRHGQGGERGSQPPLTPDFSTVSAASAGHVVFGHNSSGVQVGHIVGSVNNYYSSSESIFGSFIPTVSAYSNDVTLKRLGARNRFYDGKTPRLLEASTTYKPYPVITNRKIRRILSEIAEKFQFVDRGFAEYFHEAMVNLNRDYVRKMLEDARKQIATKQGKSHDSPNGNEDPELVVLGNLGHFCEDVAQRWSKGGPDPEFTPYSREQDIFRYLQDAHEVLYWDLMLDVFSDWRTKSRSLSGNIVLHVLNSIRLDVMERKGRLREEINTMTEEERLPLEPLVQGIDTRLSVLESVWDGTTSNSEIDDMVVAMFESKSSTTVADTQDQPQASLETSHNNTVWLVALSLIFFMAAIVPGYRGFAISMADTENSTGSTGDADFWYLIQSNIMAVLGTLLMAIPLMKESWLSPAYTWMWTFFGVGFAFSVVSIAIYPFLNTGWSSMIAFFGSVAGISSVLVLTQATPRAAEGGKGDKVKKE